MTDQTPADELRAAATRLRELTDRAIHEDRTNWSPGNTLGSKSPVVLDDPEKPSVLIETYAARLEAVNRYIAAMDPGVGRAIVGWLEEEAHRFEATVAAARRVFHDDPAECEAFLTTGPGSPSEHAVCKHVFGLRRTGFIWLRQAFGRRSGDGPTHRRSQREEAVRGRGEPSTAGSRVEPKLVRTVEPAHVLTDNEGYALCADCGTDACATYQRIQTRRAIHLTDQTPQTHATQPWGTVPSPF